MEEAESSSDAPVGEARAGEGEAGAPRPSQTLYLNNLNDRLKKAQMRKSLYCVFSPFGGILDIVVMHTLKLRGQAWIVFDSVETATYAMREMNGSHFFGKEMRIQYAKGESRVVTIERNAAGKK